MSVLINFVGGPLDGEQQVVSDININDPARMFHDHGTFRPGAMGRNVYSDYVYDHSDPQPVRPYGSGAYGSGPYGRAMYEAIHYFAYVDNSKGDIPEGPGRGGGVQAPTGQPTPSLAITSISPATGLSPVFPASGPLITITGDQLVDVASAKFVGPMEYSVGIGVTDVTQVQFNLPPGMVAGDYQVSVYSSAGYSNALPFTVTAVPILTSLTPVDTGGPSLSPGTPNWYSSHQTLITGQNLNDAALNDEYMTQSYWAWWLPNDNATVLMAVQSPTDVILPQIVHPAPVSLTVTDPAGTSNSLPVTIVEQPSGDPGLSHWQTYQNCTLMQSSTPLGGSNWYPYVITTTATDTAEAGFIVPVPGVITAPVSGEEFLAMAFVGHDANTPVRWIYAEIQWWAGNPASGGTYISSAAYHQSGYEPPDSVNDSVWTCVGTWGVCPDAASNGVPYITARLSFWFEGVQPGEVHYLYGVSFGPRW